MAGYSVFIKPSAVKELEAVQGKKERQRIVRRIRSLAMNPRPPGCQKLSGAFDRFRIRQGQLRIVYSIDDANRSVRVVKIGHRKEVYR